MIDELLVFIEGTFNMTSCDRNIMADVTVACHHGCATVDP